MSAEQSLLYSWSSLVDSELRRLSGEEALWLAFPKEIGFCIEPTGYMGRATESWIGSTTGFSSNVGCRFFGKHADTLRLVVS